MSTRPRKTLSRPFRATAFGANDRRPPKHLSAIVEVLEGRALLALVVNNIAPVQGTEFQGVVATFEAGDVDGASIADYSATIQWGDGSPNSSATIQFGSSATTFEISGVHTYATQGSFNLAVILNGANDTTAIEVGTADVANAPIVVSAVSFSATAFTAFSGNVATFTDAGNDPADMYTAAIDWGDGTTSSGSVSKTGDGAYQVDGIHTYQVAQSYDVTVTVTHVDGTTGDDTATVSVANPAPKVSGLGIAPLADVPFTGVVATFLDANTTLTEDDFAATIKWGDGAETAGTIAAVPVAPGEPLKFNVAGTHTYGSVSVFTTTIIVYRLPDNVNGTGSGSAIVNNPEIDASPLTFNAATGIPFGGVVATFTDSAPSSQPSDFTATIDWGDGTPLATGVVSFQPAANGFQVTPLVAHAYDVANSYPVIVTIDRIIGSQQVTVHSTAVVADPQLTATPVTLNLATGIAFDGVVAKFTDSLTSSQPGDFSAIIEWGDGSTTPGVIGFQPGGAGFQVVPDVPHAFAAANTYAVVVTIERNAGDQKVAVHGTAVVADASLNAVGAQGPLSAAAGLPFSGVVATLNDSYLGSKPTDFSVIIDWGDGTSSSAGTSVVQTAAGKYDIRGMHTYVNPGTFPIAVVVTRISDGQRATASTSFLASASATINAQPTTLTASAGVSKEFVVAIFAPSAPANASEFAATIAWGDGQSGVGEIKPGSTPGTFQVVGTHTYGAGTTTPLEVKVTIRRLDGSGSPATVTSSAVVVLAPISGGLDPTSDVGGGITGQSRPRLTGHAPAYSLVEIFTAIPRTGTGTILLGQTIANADGVWSLVVGPLADGSYRPTATVTPPYGSPLTLNPLRAFTVDTTPPTVASLRLTNRGRRVVATLVDDGAGIDLTSLRRARLTGLIGGPLAQRRVLQSSAGSRVRVIATDTNSNTLTLEFTAVRRRSRAGQLRLTGIADRAGNLI